jgi:O-antigen/teichoic acid export membrane protein
MSTVFELARDAIYSGLFHLAPRFANVFLLILIGRLAGPAEAGVFTLATTYLVFFTTLMRGLDDLVVRQVSREPERAGSYLISFISLRIPLAVVLYGLLWVLVRYLFDYAASTTLPILIMGLSLLPDSLTYVAQSILLGQRRFGSPAAILTGLSLLRLVGGGIVMLAGGDLGQIAWVWFALSWVGMLAMLVPASGGIVALRRPAWFDWRPLTRNWRAAVSFFFITSLATLETQMDTLILSGFQGESEVGWYGAAKTVAYSLVMFSQAYRFAVYPLMTRFALQAPEKLSRLYHQSVRLLGTVVLPMVAGIVLLSSEIVYLLFGDQFGPTVPVLEILILTLLFMFLNEPNVRLMLVQDRQNWISLFLVISVAVNFSLNLLFTPLWGATGAAAARVSSAVAFFILNQIYVSRYLIHTKTFAALSRPLLATLAMAALLWLIRTWPLVASMAMGAVVYLVALRAIGGITSADTGLLREALGRLHNRTTSEEMS